MTSDEKAVLTRGSLGCATPSITRVTHTGTQRTRAVLCATHTFSLSTSSSTTVRAPSIDWAPQPTALSRIPALLGRPFEENRQNEWHSKLNASPDELHQRQLLGADDTLRRLCSVRSRARSTWSPHRVLLAPALAPCCMTFESTITTPAPAWAVVPPDRPADCFRRAVGHRHGAETAACVCLRGADKDNSDEEIAHRCSPRGRPWFRAQDAFERDSPRATSWLLPDFYNEKPCTL